MSHTYDNDAINRRIWRGKRAALEEMRKLYESGELSFPAWVSALYSFRNYSDVHQELLALAPKILTYVREHFEHGNPSYADTADEADIISTVLVWLRGALNPNCFDVNHEYVDAARKVLGFGKRMASAQGLDGHTFPLLLLTEVDLVRRYGMSREVGRIPHLLWMVQFRLTSIKDMNQRNRICRKLGWLLRETHRPSSGWFYGLRAVFMPNVPLAVRAKSAAALIGVGM